MSYPFNSIPSNNPQNFSLANPVGIVRNTRDPTGQDNPYPTGTLWENTSTQDIWINTSSTISGAVWIKLVGSGSGSGVFTLSDNFGTKTFPDGTGNIAITGNPDLKVLAGTNSLHFTDLVKVTPYVVGIDPNQYRFTSIQAAINQAVADGAAFGAQKLVLVTFGTYTENVAFFDYVNVGSVMGPTNQSALIIGNCTYGGSGTIGLDGLTFRSVGGLPGLALTHSGTVNIHECTFNAVSGKVLLLNGSGLTNTSNCNFTAVAGQGIFDIRNGANFFYSSLVLTQDTPSVCSGGQTYFFAMYKSDSWVLTGSALLVMVSSILIAPGTLPVALIHTGATFGTFNSAAVSSAVSGYAVQGNGPADSGTYIYGNTICPASATQIDPDLTAVQLPAISPLQIPSGGTGNRTFPNLNSVLFTGTTATGNLQAPATGAAGTVLTSNGAGALPTWQAGSNAFLTITPINFASSPYTVLTADQYLSVDTSGGAITVNLPNTTTTGRVVYIKDATGNAATNNITITTTGGVVNLDGATSFVISNSYGMIAVIWNGVSYEIL